MRIWILVALLGTSVAHAATPDTAIIAAHYQAWLKLHPLDATELGRHDKDLDSTLPPFGPQGDRAILAELRDADAKLAATETAAGCNADCIFELRLVRFYIAQEIFNTEVLRSHERYADEVLGFVARSVFPLIKRDFAPLADRAGYAIARLNAAPHAFDEALAILKKSKIVTKHSIDITLEEIDDSASFLENDVPAAFASLQPVAVAKVKAAGTRAAASLRAYGKALRTEIAPHATARFSLGEATFKQLLSAEFMIDEPPAQLLVRAEAELHRLQAEYNATARRIAPKQSAREVTAALKHDHPATKDVLSTVQGHMQALRDFIVAHDIVTLPTSVMPKVEETPPYMRATTQAAMNTPGAFDTRATEAFYFVTLPEASWTPARVEDYLGGSVNNSIIDVVSIHEVLPGHFVQLMWMQKIPGEARRMQGDGAYIEGWAHYTEQMMLDEGWGRDASKADPTKADRLRLAQLSDALLRAARFVVALKIHTADMSFDDAKRFFEVDGYQSAAVALVEAKRGTEDPFYFQYTWGKLEFLRMRDELKAKQKAGFSLKRFHDAVLAEGPLPLPLLRARLGLSNASH